MPESAAAAVAALEAAEAATARPQVTTDRSAAAGDELDDEEFQRTSRERLAKWDESIDRLQKSPVKVGPSPGAADDTGELAAGVEAMLDGLAAEDARAGVSRHEHDSLGDSDGDDDGWNFAGSNGSDAMGSDPFAMSDDDAAAADVGGASAEGDDSFARSGTGHGDDEEFVGGEEAEAILARDAADYADDHRFSPTADELRAAESAATELDLSGVHRTHDGTQDGDANADWDSQASGEADGEDRALVDGLGLDDDDAVGDVVGGALADAVATVLDDPSSHGKTGTLKESHASANSAGAGGADDTAFSPYFEEKSGPLGSLSGQRGAAARPRFATPDEADVTPARESGEREMSSEKDGDAGAAAAEPERSAHLMDSTFTDHRLSAVAHHASIATDATVGEFSDANMFESVRTTQIANESHVSVSSYSTTTVTASATDTAAAHSRPPRGSPASDGGAEAALRAVEEAVQTKAPPDTAARDRASVRGRMGAMDAEGVTKAPTPIGYTPSRTELDDTSLRYLQRKHGEGGVPVSDSNARKSTDDDSGSDAAAMRAISANVERAGGHAGHGHWLEIPHDCRRLRFSCRNGGESTADVSLRNVGEEEIAVHLRVRPSVGDSTEDSEELRRWQAAQGATGEESSESTDAFWVAPALLHIAPGAMSNVTVHYRPLVLGSLRCSVEVDVGPAADPSTRTTAAHVISLSGVCVPRVHAESSESGSDSAAAGRATKLDTIPAEGVDGKVARAASNATVHQYNVSAGGGGALRVTEYVTSSPPRAPARQASHDTGSDEQDALANGEPASSAALTGGAAPADSGGSPPGSEEIAIVCDRPVVSFGYVAVGEPSMRRLLMRCVARAPCLVSMNVVAAPRAPSGTTVETVWPGDDASVSASAQEAASERGVVSWAGEMKKSNKRASEGAFSVQLPNEVAMLPGKEASVWVQFCPTQAASYRAGLLLRARFPPAHGESAGDSASVVTYKVPLLGYGGVPRVTVAPVMPRAQPTSVERTGAVDFGAIGDQTDRHVTVRNVGCRTAFVVASVRAASAKDVRSGAVAFDVSPRTCTVPAGGAVQLSVTAKPRVARLPRSGTKDATAVLSIQWGAEHARRRYLIARAHASHAPAVAGGGSDAAAAATSDDAIAASLSMPDTGIGGVGDASDGRVALSRLSHTFAQGPITDAASPAAAFPPPPPVRVRLAPGVWEAWRSPEFRFDDFFDAALLISQAQQASIGLYASVSPEALHSQAGAQRRAAQELTDEASGTPEPGMVGGDLGAAEAGVAPGTAPALSQGHGVGGGSGGEDDPWVVMPTLARIDVPPAALPLLRRPGSDTSAVPLATTFLIANRTPQALPFRVQYAWPHLVVRPARGVVAGFDDIRVVVSLAKDTDDEAAVGHSFGLGDSREGWFGDVVVWTGEPGELGVGADAGRVAGRPRGTARDADAGMTALAGRHEAKMLRVIVARDALRMANLLHLLGAPRGDPTQFTDWAAEPGPGQRVLLNADAEAAHARHAAAAKEAAAARSRDAAARAHRAATAVGDTGAQLHGSPPRRRDDASSAGASPSRQRHDEFLRGASVSAASAVHYSHATSTRHTTSASSANAHVVERFRRSYPVPASAAAAAEARRTEAARRAPADRHPGIGVDVDADHGHAHAEASGGGALPQQSLPGPAAAPAGPQQPQSLTAREDAEVGRDGAADGAAGGRAKRDIAVGTDAAGEAQATARTSEATQTTPREAGPPTHAAQPSERASPARVATQTAYGPPPQLGYRTGAIGPGHAPPSSTAWPSQPIPGEAGDDLLVAQAHKHVAQFAEASARAAAERRQAAAGLASTDVDVSQERRTRDGDRRGGRDESHRSRGTRRSKGRSGRRRRGHSRSLSPSASDSSRERRTRSRRGGRGTSSRRRGRTTRAEERSSTVVHRAQVQTTERHYRTTGTRKARAGSVDGNSHGQAATGAAAAFAEAERRAEALAADMRAGNPDAPEFGGGSGAARDRQRRQRGLYFGVRAAVFPATPEGEASRIRVQLCNSADVDLDVVVEAPMPPFSTRHHRVRLKPRSFVKLPVRFCPTHAGFRTAELCADARLVNRGAPGPAAGSDALRWVRWPHLPRRGDTRPGDGDGGDAAPERLQLVTSACVELQGEGVLG